MNKLILSTLGHVWILDLDGTIVKHNGYRAEPSGLRTEYAVLKKRDGALKLRLGFDEAL